MYKSIINKEHLTIMNQNLLFDYIFIKFGSLRRHSKCNKIESILDLTETRRVHFVRRDVVIKRRLDTN